jgi:hypothetical protein
MSWTNSKIFSAGITDALNSTWSPNVDADNVKAALYNDSITPSQTVASASAAYGGGVWTAGSSPNIQDASGWPYVGRQLLSVSSAFSSNVYTLDAADTVSANSTTTLTNAYGTLVYNDTVTTPVADQGFCYNYFGGANSVTSGQFTIIWNASGIMNLTL